MSLTYLFRRIARQEDKYLRSQDLLQIWRILKIGFNKITLDGKWRLKLENSLRRNRSLNQNLGHLDLQERIIKRTLIISNSEK